MWEEKSWQIVQIKYDGDKRVEKQLRINMWEEGKELGNRINRIDWKTNLVSLL